MAIPDKHPQFSSRLIEWVQMEDTYAGERVVKSKRMDYLPATEGMIIDGMTTPTSPGWKDYEAYLIRAYYHDIVKEGVNAMIGLMHNKPAAIKLPAKLEALRAKCTVQGEGLQQLLRRINLNQLVKGRVGLLVDVPTGKSVDEAVPYIAVYDAMRIINWDAGRENDGRNALQLVVLDESGQRRVGLMWKTEQKYRVCTRGGMASLEDSEVTPTADQKYTVATLVNRTTSPVDDDFVTPSLGGVELDEIPFVFIGATDLAPEPEMPPLLGLSNIALAIYRAEADYRQTLYLQGQQTLVVIGGNVGDADPTQLRTGAKGVIDLKIGGDAKYIGVSPSGLGEMRSSLKSDQERANAAGVSFLDSGAHDGQRDVGEGLRIRVAARTATISTLAKAGGLGLEIALKFAARWVGADPEEVSVKPFSDFADQSVAGAALLAIMQAKQLGLPLSLKSIHGMTQSNDMTDMDYDDELDQIEDEAGTMLGNMVNPMAAQQPPMDDSFLNEPDDSAPAPPGDTAPPIQPGSVAPPNKNVPIIPHVRGSPNPLKKKVGKKGDSAK